VDIVNAGAAVTYTT
jgi:hypothetical protein